MNPLKIFCSKHPDERQVSTEPDSEIAPLCAAINSLEGCKTTSSCSQHYFADEENVNLMDTPSGGRQVYIAVLFEDVTSMAWIIDAFMSSPYRWKIVVARRHGREYNLKDNQVRLIFQYMFDNKRGRDKEFSRIISYIKSRVV